MQRDGLTRDDLEKVKRELWKLYDYVHIRQTQTVPHWIEDWLGGALNSLVDELDRREEVS